MKTLNEGPKFYNIVGIDTYVTIEDFEDFSRVVSENTAIASRLEIVFGRTIQIDLYEIRGGGGPEKRGIWQRGTNGG